MQGISKKIVIVFVVFFTCSWCRSTLDPSTTENENYEQTLQNHSKFAVVAYLPEWRYNGVDYDAICEHLTHLIFFSIEVDKQGSFAAMDRYPAVDCRVFLSVVKLRVFSMCKRNELIRTLA